MCLLVLHLYENIYFRGFDRPQISIAILCGRPKESLLAEAVDRIRYFLLKRLDFGHEDSVRAKRSTVVQDPDRPTQQESVAGFLGFQAEESVAAFAFFVSAVASMISFLTFKLEDTQRCNPWIRSKLCPR